jgi:hypothetical protein
MRHGAKWTLQALLSFLRARQPERRDNLVGLPCVPRPVHALASRRRTSSLQGEFGDVKCGSAVCPGGWLSHGRYGHIIQPAK